MPIDIRASFRTDGDSGDSEYMIIFRKLPTNRQGLKANLHLSQCFKLGKYVGGESGIRTHDTLARITVFETVAFDHSATSPARRL